MKTQQSPEPIYPLRRAANTYKPEDIRQWGLQRFMDEVAPQKPFQIPNLGFTEEENKRMDDLIHTITTRLLPIDRRIAGINPCLCPYRRIQSGKTKSNSTAPGTSARNMGKNDLWIAATALYFDLPLHTVDNDFDHLTGLNLRIIHGT